jgi:hypothetical protein
METEMNKLISTTLVVLALMAPVAAHAGSNVDVQAGDGSVIDIKIIEGDDDGSYDEGYEAGLEAGGHYEPQIEWGSRCVSEYHGWYRMRVSLPIGASCPFMTPFGAVYAWVDY